MLWREANRLDQLEPAPMNRYGEALSRSGRGNRRLVIHTCPSVPACVVFPGQRQDARDALALANRLSASLKTAVDQIGRLDRRTDDDRPHADGQTRQQQ